MERESPNGVAEVPVEQKISYADRLVSRMSVLHKTAYERLVRENANHISFLRREEGLPPNPGADWIAAETEIKEQMANYVLVKGGSIVEDSGVNGNRSMWRTTYRAELDILDSIKSGVKPGEPPRNGNE